jgi:uncharacterized protein (TIGR00255 family)
MTGYGEAERDSAVGRVRAEVRTVNHRFLSLNVRSPAALDRFETRFREWLKPHISRGHVNLTYRLAGLAGEVEGVRPLLTLDADRAREYIDLFRGLKETFGLAGEVTLEMIARQTDLLVRDEGEVPGLDEERVHDVTDRAARAAVAMREAEGRSLARDLEDRLDAMGAALAVIEVRAPERLRRERDRLRRSIAELAGDAGMDPDRLAREVALIADRWDISEEIVRLRAHIDHFRAMLEADDVEPVGKRLGFLVQEMHREANTIGSKANDAGIEHRVVANKNEIERLREQVENIE